MICFGADIGYRWLRRHRLERSYGSASANFKVLSEAIKKLTLSGYSVGPFPKPPFANFICNSLGVVPKKNGDHRVIMDLSFHFGSSVNQFIAKEKFSLSYCKVDNAVRFLTLTGRRALMAKVDVKNAFRLIPVRPQDWELLGFQLKTKFYFNRVLTFELRSSPFLFCQGSNAIHGILEDATSRSTILITSTIFC